MWPIAIGLLAYVYLIVPIIVYVRRRPMASGLAPEWCETEKPLLADDRAFLEGTETALARIGFGPPTRFTSQGARVAVHMSVLLHRDGYTLATIASAVGRRRAVAFGTSFGADQKMFTTNQSISRLFPNMPHVDAIRCASITDPVALFEIHRRRTEKVAAVSAIPDGDVLAHANRETRRVREWLTAIGYVRRATDGSERLTLRGVFLMAWRRLPPWKQINDWRDARSQMAFN